MSQYRPRQAHLLQDCVFLASLVALSVALYTDQLGFYYDDWALLGHMLTSEDPSFFGLLHTLFSEVPNLQNRPIQVLYCAALHWLFGVNPRWYHLTNAGVFLSGILLLYLSLQALRVPRVLSVAIPAVYALMPNYSTDRFWYTVFSANLSMSLYGAALYCEARALRRRRWWLWQITSVVSLLISGLAYEVFLPLFLLNPVLVWYLTRSPDTPGSKHFPWGSWMVKGAVVIVLLVFKVLTTTRLEQASVSVRQHLFLNSWLFREAIAMNYLTYGFGLPLVFWKVLREYTDTMVMIGGGIIGLIVFAYVYRLGTDLDRRMRSIPAMLWLTLLGFGVFGLGYAVFMFNYTLGFTPAGVANRTAIAAALGVAVSLVAVARAVSAWWRSTLAQRGVFAAGIAMLCAMGFTIIGIIASFWVKAYEKEQDILAGVRQTFVTLPAHSTLILDGFCPYVGPAVVFTIDWDVTGALMVLYKQRDIRGDVVLPYTRVTENSLVIHQEYPYRQLYVYHHAQRIGVELTNAQVARWYFATFNPDYTNGCPPFQGEHGVPFF